MFIKINKRHVNKKNSILKKEKFFGTTTLITMKKKIFIDLEFFTFKKLSIPTSVDIQTSVT